MLTGTTLTLIFSISEKERDQGKTLERNAQKELVRTQSSQMTDQGWLFSG
jgi:hypothetical protein